MLPGRDGIDVSSALRAALDEVDERVAGFDAGAGDFSRVALCVGTGRRGARPRRRIQ